jgi:hypothetical protein
MRAIFLIVTFASVQAESYCQEMVRQPRPRNALSVFADNKFNSWTISGRIDLTPELGRGEAVSWLDAGRVVLPPCSPLH